MSDNALQKIEEQPQLPAIVPLEAKTSQQARIDEVTEALLPAYQKASELRLSDEENKALLVPFEDEQVEIRPHDGLLYLPHIHISDRLIRVLGAGQWAMVRRREWIEGNRIYAEYVMKVRGCFVGESVGAMDYHPSNPRMNYSDALEGTRGECIRRIAAKDLGCGSQVWNPEYCRQWIARYAEQVKGKWQRKGQGNTQNHLNPPAERGTNVPQTAIKGSEAATNQQLKPSEPRVATDKTRAWFLAEMRKRFSDATLLQWGVDDGPPFMLMPNETLEDWKLEYVPTSQLALKEKIQRCAQFMHIDLDKSQEPSRPPTDSAEQAIGASQANVVPRKDGSDPVHHSEEWYQFEVPFGKDKGTPLGELDKKTLFGWWANFEVEHEYNGKPKKPETIAKDERFREMLDQAGAFYDFEEPA